MKKILSIALLMFATMNMQSAEGQLATWNITPDESNSFCKHLNGAVNGCRKAISDGVLTDKNSIYVILQDLQDKLNKNNNDVEKFISEESLQSSLVHYRGIDNRKNNRFLLEQIQTGRGDIEKAKNILIENRKIAAGLILLSRQPKFSPAAVGEPATPKVMNFIQRNQDYGVDSEAANDYIASFIYKVIIAQRIPKNN